MFRCGRSAVWALVLVALGVAGTSALAQGAKREGRASASPEEARQRTAHRLFQQLGLEAGRIVLMVPKQPKGEAIPGAKGYFRAAADELSQADFADGSRIAVFEKDEAGRITTREALIVSDGDGLAVLDEGISGVKRRARATPPQPDAGAEAEARRKRIEARLAKRRQQRAEAGVTTRGADSDAVATYVATVDEGETAFVVAGEEVTTGAWTSIEVEGEPPLECYESASSKPGTQYDLGGGTKCKTGLEAEPGQVWVGTAPFCKTSEESCHEIGMVYVASDTWGEGAECMVGKKALCRPPEADETVEIWLGKAPYCMAQERDCEELGLVFEREAIDGGDGKTCASGTKVLCRSRKEGEPKTTYVWVGKAPFCAGKEKECTDRRMKYVTKSKDGKSVTFPGDAPPFGKKCATGKKVLCMSEE